jgi:hypothetical protein
VQTLALLESARPAPQNEPQAVFVSSVLMPALERYRAGDKAGAIDAWLRGPSPGRRGPVLQAGAAGGAAVVVHGRGREPNHPTRTRRPRAESVPIFRERRELLLAWLPNVESFDLPGATHLLHVQNPGGMADALARFFARHPIAASA